MKQSPKRKEALVVVAPIEPVIQIIRGQKVILDADLTEIYGVTTKRLNEQVKRNRKRFPDDFMFRLKREESQPLQRSRSQFATLKRGQNIKYLPYAFTEHGAVMAANVLNSPQAVQTSIYVVRFRVGTMIDKGTDVASLYLQYENAGSTLGQQPGSPNTQDFCRG